MDLKTESTEKPSTEKPPTLSKEQRLCKMLQGTIDELLSKVGCQGLVTETDDGQYRIHMPDCWHYTLQPHAQGSVFRWFRDGTSSFGHRKTFDLDGGVVEILRHLERLCLEIAKDSDGRIGKAYKAAAYRLFRRHTKLQERVYMRVA